MLGFVNRDSHSKYILEYVDNELIWNRIYKSYGLFKLNLGVVTLVYIFLISEFDSA